MKKSVKRKNKIDNKNNNLKKTIYALFSISFIAIILGMFIQLDAQSKVNSCSYLDPITIDIIAFLSALFLIVEGLARIYEHPSVTVKRQFTRIIRVAGGFMILIIHIIQFIHK